jgi:dTDP-4-amino-4,6-dideoxygalactose transaminase
MLNKDFRNTMSGFQIPFTGLQRQYNNLREEILNTTDQVLSSGQLMNGPWTEQFENWISIKSTDAYAVTCHSGTQALEIIAGYWKSMNVGARPVVLVPSLTFSATAHAFMRAGWDLHFIDVDVNGLFDPGKIPPGLDYQAVVLVGLYGASVSHIGRVNDWTHWTDKDVIVIEDAAQNWLGNKSTRVGHASAISFDPMKNLACFGNGGAVVTNNQDLAMYARSWGNHNKGDYKVLDGASNSRMSELDCAHMMVKTRYINQWQSRRKDIATHMRDRLRNANLRCLINRDNEIKHAYHKFVIDVDHRDQVQGRLWDASIDTRIHYAQPLHDDSVLRKYPGPNMLSVATALSQRVLSLPIYPELTDSEVEYIIDSVIRCVS